MAILYGQDPNGQLIPVALNAAGAIVTESAPFSFAISAPQILTIEKLADNDQALSFAYAVTAGAAGTIVLKALRPRDGAPTETFAVVKGESIPGQWIEVMTGTDCWPVKVIGV